jgi:Uma2 family endonuclease
MQVMALATRAAARGRPLRRADLARTPEDGRRYELIDGQLYVSAAPGLVHQRAGFRLATLLAAAAPAVFEVVPGGFGVALADDTEIQPDIVVGLRKDFTERDIVSPALCAEVLSPSTRRVDLTVKRHRLEQAGIPSYWIVDPNARPAAATLSVFELGRGGTYQQVARVVGEEPFHAQRPFPLTLAPADLVR